MLSDTSYVMPIIASALEGSSQIHLFLNINFNDPLNRPKHKQALTVTCVCASYVLTTSQPQIMRQLKWPLEATIKS